MEAQLIRLGLWNQVVCDVESTTTEDDAKAKDEWLKKLVMCRLRLGLKAPAWASKPGLRPTNIVSRA